MALFGSRISQQPPRLVGRTWNDVSHEIQDFLDVIGQFSDDVNSLDEPPTPNDVALGGTSDPGTNTTPANGDHVHALDAGSPVALGDALADGTSAAAARADHVHALAVRIALAAATVGTRRVLNFIQGAGIALTVADNGGGDRVDVTVAASSTYGVVWTKYSFTHTQLQAAAMANDIELVSLPAAGLIHGVKIKHSALFAGGTISDYKVSVGIVGNLTKYAGAFDLDTAVSGTNFQVSSVVGSENHGAAVSIRLAATSTGANLDQSTAGALDVWLLTSVAA